MSVLRWLGKIYAFTFYVTYKFTSSFNNQNWAEENAVFLMGLLQFALLVEIACGVAVLTGRTPIVFSKVAALIGMAAVLLLTYFMLVKRRQWIRYKLEFESYTRRKRFYGSLAVGIVVAAAFLGIEIVKYAIR
jgi:hypothetical protein